MISYMRFCLCLFGFALVVPICCVGADDVLTQGEYPVISPDGRRLAFQREVDNRLAVFLKDVDTGSETCLEADGMSAFPAWSPDGSSLVYTYGMDTNTSFEVMKSGTGGGYGIRLWREGVKKDLSRGRCRDATPSFSPDGKTVFYTSMRDSGTGFKGGICRSNLGSLPINGGAPSVVHEPPAGKSSFGMSQPVVSPDGLRIVWSESDWYSTPWRLMCAELDNNTCRTNTIERLSPEKMFAWAPRWSPDGRYIIFTGYRDGDPTWSLYVLNVETKHFRRFCTGRDGNFTPDMKQVIYSRDGKIFQRKVIGLDLPDSGTFSKIAYADALDFAAWVDVEKRKGTDAVIEHILETGCDAILWRTQTGAMPRYPSAEESKVDNENPFNRLRIGAGHGQGGVYGWLRMDRGENMVDYALNVCRAKGVTAGVHVTYEENHWSSFTLGTWNLNHPEYLCRRQDGSIFAGRCSFAWPEVMAHKMRLFRELLAMKPEVVLIDMFRGGSWQPAIEYVTPVIDEWRRRHGCEPPKDWHDERWMNLVSEYQHDYFRELRKCIEESGLKTRMIAGLVYMDKADKTTWERYAMDWKMLIKTGILDGIAIQSVQPESNRLLESTEEIYRQYVGLVHELGGLVFLPLAEYTLGNQYGYPKYAKELNLSRKDTVKKLLSLARSCGGDGIVMECVDYNNYKPEEREIIRMFQGE